MIEQTIITDGSEEEILKHSLQFCITRYEKNHNIIVKHYTKIADNEDTKLYAVMKSDNSTSLFVLFKCGVQTNFWSFWMLTKRQFDFLRKDVVRNYIKIEEMNQLQRER